MKLFDIVNGEVALSAECIAIPPFRILWDSHKDKKLAQRKIEYIIFMYKWDTVYKALSPEDRDRKVKLRVFNDENFEIDDQMKMVIEDYKELQNTINTRLLLAEEEGMEYIIRQFNSIREKENLVDNNNKPLITPDLVGKWMEKANKAVEVHTKLLKAVRSEQSTLTKVKGGSEIGSFELPNKR
nr:MAG TPA: hypothetical protein [Caudoviricetes sp.]